MRRSIAGHLYNTETARPIERVEGQHEELVLYMTKMKRFFLHITADTASIYAGYDKEEERLIPRENILPVSIDEHSRL